MDLVTFAASAGLALLLTNFDNLAVLFGLLRPLGTVRAVFTYVTAQMLVLVAVLSLAELVGDVLMGHAGYLGFIPISMGLFGLWRNRTARHQDATVNVQNGAASMVMAGVTFLTMSVDSFTMMVPLLTDSAKGYRLAAFLGAVAAIALMASVALVFSGWADRARNWVSRAEVLGPYIMILAGIYILLDSGTDLL